MADNENKHINSHQPGPPAIVDRRSMRCHHHECIHQENHRWMGYFLKGRISANGGHLMQDKYTTKYFDPKTLSGDFFQTKLRKGLWMIYDALWKVRFSVLRDPNYTSSLSNIELNKFILPYILQIPKVQSWRLRSTSPPRRPVGHSPKINIL